MDYRLCDALLAVFEHGISKPSVLGVKCHPWVFIEEVDQILSENEQPTLIYLLILLLKSLLVVRLKFTPEATIDYTILFCLNI